VGTDSFLWCEVSPSWPPCMVQGVNVRYGEAATTVLEAGPGVITSSGYRLILGMWPPCMAQCVNVAYREAATRALWGPKKRTYKNARKTKYGPFWWQNWLQISPVRLIDRLIEYLAQLLEHPFYVRSPALLYIHWQN